jgi:hypothetical protein
MTFEDVCKAYAEGMLVLNMEPNMEIIKTIVAKYHPELVLN